MKRICQTTAALCLSLLFYGHAEAEHSGPYIGAFIGGNVPMDAKSTDNQGSFNLTFKPALQESVVLGWDFEHGSSLGEGRIEVECTRRSNALDKVKFVEGSFKGGGSIKADSLLANFIGVVRNDTPLSPYGGVGVGVARFGASNMTVSGQPMSNSSSVVFAYQLSTGFDVALNKYLNLDIGYRFFNSAKPGFTEADGRKFSMNYFGHSAVFGARVGF